jgi:hypothetical protein
LFIDRWDRGIGFCGCRLIHILLINMNIKYTEIGVCGLSCRLCPSYYTQGDSRCGGCKSKGRINVGCPFITCAIKQKGVEFCWQCPEHEICKKWRGHRKRGKSFDSFVCYQKLESNIDFIKSKGISAFLKNQLAKEKLLTVMLDKFNEGRSKSFYCIAATVMDIQELDQAIALAKKESKGMDIKGKAAFLHSIINGVAAKRKYHLKLRK